MKKNKYNDFWLAFVNIKAKMGYEFNDLIDFDGQESCIVYKGAWANIIIRAISIEEVLEIITAGLNELNFEVIFIDRIENISSLIEYKEIDDSVISEVNWLMKSTYKFMISDKLFPYE